MCDDDVYRVGSSTASVSADCQRDAALCAADPVLHQLRGSAYSQRLGILLGFQTLPSVVNISGPFACPFFLEFSFL